MVCRNDVPFMYFWKFLASSLLPKKLKVAYKLRYISLKKINFQIFKEYFQFKKNTLILLMLQNSPAHPDEHFEHVPSVLLQGSSFRQCPSHLWTQSLPKVPFSQAEFNLYQIMLYYVIFYNYIKCYIRLFFIICKLNRLMRTKQNKTIRKYG